MNLKEEATIGRAVRNTNIFTFGNVWRNSRDYKGSDFRDYISPNFYEPLREVNTREYIDLMQSNRVVALNTPQQKGAFGLSTEQLENLQVSPDIPNGIYDRNVTALIYYMDTEFQYVSAFRVVTLNDLELQMFTDDPTLYQRFTFWVADQVPSLSADVDTGFPNLDSLIERVTGAFDFPDQIGFWVQSGNVKEPLSVVTADITGNTAGVTLDTETRKAVNFLPLLLLGGGLLAGSAPLAIAGGGLYLLGRR